MPLRKDIHKVMVLGSGPIVIGQAAEFDYAGTQACRALREEGLEVVLVVARVEEWMVFKNKPLYLDRTRFRYQLSAKVTGDKVEMEISQISYYYAEQTDGTNGESYKAEEWITDQAAIAKSGKKLYPRSGKFRKKTIDRAEEIFALAIDKFEVKRTVEVRSGVVVTE